MRNNGLKLIFITLIVISFVQCDNWEDNLNIDPNNPATGGSTNTSYDFKPEEFMLDMIYKVIGGWDYIHWNVASAVCAYHGKTISLSQGNRHQAWHAFDDAPEGGPWKSGYSAIRYIKSMRKAALANNDIAYQALADIWECYNFFNLTLLYGDIPYFEAISDNPPLSPVYDRQQDIYFALIAKLKRAALQIEPNSTIEGSNDLIYYGDMLKWKKFANTLLIRYAMYMSDAAPDSAKVLLNTIISDPVTYPIMQSNADNAYFHYDGVQYKSRYFLLASSKIDEAPFSNVFIERLVSLKDPRLTIYANPAKLYHTNSETNVVPSNPGIDKYAGHLYGITTDNAYSSAWNGGANYASKLGTYFRTEDDKGTATSECAKVPLALATYSELLFFLAEAKEKSLIETDIPAKEFYEKAVIASFEQYNANFSDVKYMRAFGDSSLKSYMEYLSQPQVNYEGGRNKLVLIAEQKWIASFLLMFEPYFDHRRTMLPRIRASSGANAYIATGSGTKFPSRAAYPASEFSTNLENVTKANETGYDIPITSQSTRNLALMWLLRNKGSEFLQMPVFQEPNYPSEYPSIKSDPAFGTNFLQWYNTHWNTMFWWKNNDN